MTVDEILATGRYIDRRGSYWQKGTTGSWWNFPTGRRRNPSQMRLMIERDQHRDECRGIFDCDVHPVPTVVTELGWFYAVAAGEGTITGERHGTLPEAMDAARALAVGE